MVGNERTLNDSLKVRLRWSCSEEGCWWRGCSSLEDGAVEDELMRALVSLDATLVDPVRDARFSYVGDGGTLLLLACVSAS